MYKLVYWIDGVRTEAKNKDPKVLRGIIKCLSNDDIFELQNEGGCMLDSSWEHFKGLPKRK